MQQPSVCCLALTADRQTFTERSIRSFLAQSYERKGLLIFDTGRVPFQLQALSRDESKLITIARLAEFGRPIGWLRNAALHLISQATSNAAEEMENVYRNQVICHWDVDDWSAALRISDQVKLLVESGKQCVGYREMLFWDSRPQHMGSLGKPYSLTGEAWLYTNVDPRYCIGASLCYWRATWEAKPFPECMLGEDRAWLKDLDSLGVAAFGCRDDGDIGPGVGRLIAEIHAGSTVTKYVNPGSAYPDPRDTQADGTPYWCRTPEWDSRVREILETA